MEEVARGTSIQDLRLKLANKNERKEEEASPPERNKIPNDLVQIQAYIRWEKAGKPNYSPDQQKVETKYLFEKVLCL